ncbi:MAG: hypothetical protein QXV69_05345 [Sulfolobaceae archaeon]
MIVETSKTFSEVIVDISNYYLNNANFTDDILLKAEFGYMTTIEGIKALSNYLNIEYKTISEAVRKLSKILGEWVDFAWDVAFKLHYDFYIKGYVDEEYINYALKIINDFIVKVREVVSD